jgi:hypothetical protein
MPLAPRASVSEPCPTLSNSPTCSWFKLPCPIMSSYKMSDLTVSHCYLSYPNSLFPCSTFLLSSPVPYLPPQKQADKQYPFVQLVECQNAIRQMPEAFQDLISMGCNYDDAVTGLRPGSRAPLALVPALATIAQAQAAEMATHNFVSSSSWNGTNPARRIQAAVPSATRAAELVAAGQSSVLEVIITMIWFAPLSRCLPHARLLTAGTCLTCPYRSLRLLCVKSRRRQGISRQEPV